MNNDIIIDVSNINYCVGPCNSKKEEKKPVSNNNIYYTFKPHSGGRYKELCYPIDNKYNLILKNVRICNQCNNRYLEFCEENCYDNLKLDAKIILEKIKKI